MRRFAFAAAAAPLVAAAAVGRFTLVEDPERVQTRLEDCPAAKLEEYRRLTDWRIAQIRATPNMEIPAGAPKYYLSEKKGDDGADGRTPATAWKTTGRLEKEEVPPGAYVLFERGGTYRKGFRARDGVTYTAYGDGPKPCVCASPEDGAAAAKWSPAGAPDVWVYEIGTKDVGTLVFDHGAAHAIKIVPVFAKDGSTTAQYTKRPFAGWRDLEGDLHFWHDYRKTKFKASEGSGKLYLKCRGNPGERFRSIEFLVRENAVRVGGAKNVTVDNLHVRYTGAHGVGAGTTENLKVANCEFSWIGGSILTESWPGRTWAVRYGNAVEIYGGCDGYVVDNCYIWQIYDTGITHQYNVPAKEKGKRYDQKNVRYSNNVIERCCWSIEYFLTALKSEGNQSRMENVLFENNLMWDAGKGLCEQRPDLDQAAHVKAWPSPERNRAKNYLIRNNLMAHSECMLVQAAAGLSNPDGSDSLPAMEGNVVIGRREGQLFGGVAQGSPCREKYGDKSQEIMNSRGKGNRALAADPLGRR